MRAYRAGGLGSAGVLLCSLALVSAPVGSAAQVTVRTTGAALFESYELSPGVATSVSGQLSSVDRVSEFSLPLTASAQIGRQATLTLATGYARVQIEGSGRETSSISGALDTELRLAVQAVRDRVTVFATSSFPTGIGSVEQDDVSVLGVLTSDVIGFSAANLGGGGAVGGGIAVAAPAGRMAFGGAASFRASGTYQPVEGRPSELRPGGELRVRLGIEGPVAQRSFLRISGVFSRRGDDEVNGELQSSVGNRLSGYVSLDQGLGSTTLALYAFNLFRSASGLEQTPVGIAVLNRGNVFAAGVRWTFSVASDTQLTPNVEIRDSRAEMDETSSGLQRVGTTTRFGVDLRRRMNPTLAAVVRAGGHTGSIVDAGTDIDVTGYRVSLQLEILP